MSTNTSVTTPLSCNIVPAVYNFSVLGNGTTAQVVNMRSSALTSLGTLTINSNSTLQTNALNVDIGVTLLYLLQRQLVFTTERFPVGTQQLLTELVHRLVPLRQVVHSKILLLISRVEQLR
jgi:hypothetical protein